MRNTWIEALTTGTHPASITAVATRASRHEAALARLSDEGREAWPPAYADPFPETSKTIPECRASALSAESVGGGVAHHGSVIVRELLSPRQVAALRKMQERIHSQCKKSSRDRSGWYVPFIPPPYSGENKLRDRVQNLGGNWLIDSPRGLDLVLDYLESSGVIELMSDHFGERPAISHQKTTLRSVPPDTDRGGWHQDGSFLGDDVRTRNLWIALSTCGGGTPARGLDIVPARIEQILPIDPAIGGALIAPEEIDRANSEHPIVTPGFAPGDAIFFDEKLVHRTAQGGVFSDSRYALECWFFAPSHANASYTPILT